jgi:hypothetical protein
MKKNCRIKDTSKILVLSYLGSKSSEEWLSPLIEVCNRLQYTSPIWSYEGHSISLQEIEPLISLYATAIKQGEYCIVMSASKPRPTQSLIKDLLTSCISSTEEEIVTDCNVSILTPHQERYCSNLLEDLEVKSVIEAISTAGDNEENFMQNLLKIVMDRPACTKFFLANFFAEQNFDDEVYTLLRSALDENYKPAISFIKKFAK